MEWLDITAAELGVRIERLQQALLEKDVDGALIVQKTDLFYFSATSQQGYLYVPSEGKPLLMAFKDFDRARQESPLTQVVPIGSPRKLPAAIASHGLNSPGVLGLELDVLPVNLYFQYQKIFEHSKLTDISTEIRLIRAVKSDYEIDCIKQAARGSDLVCGKVSELLAEGKSELELAGELESYARSLGHQGIVRMRLWGSELFYGHLLSGADGAVPSYLASPTGGKGPSTLTGQGAGFRKIRRDEPILVDYVFALNGYLSDHTRIFCMGKLADDLLAGHEAMLDIQEEVMKHAKPGVASGDIYELMISSAEEKGYGEWFMGVGERRIRFSGHGIGLELDEFPFLAKGQELKLERNMIIALEPKLVMPGKGVVGIENTHKVTDQGLVPLTCSPDSITFI
ncbi:MAG: Xaa-Pro peptidase family protein [Desulfofustis sp.]|nr:Xaa-Pro peptidase family protein [Desulfofustis sp.]